MLLWLSQATTSVLAVFKVSRPTFSLVSIKDKAQQYVALTGHDHIRISDHRADSLIVLSLCAKTMTASVTDYISIDHYQCGRLNPSKGVVRSDTRCLLEKFIRCLL